MDDETREALELTPDELLSMAAEGKRARVRHTPPRRLRKPRDLNQRGAAIVHEATSEPSGEAGGIVVSERSVSAVHIEANRPQAIPLDSITGTVSS